MPTLGVLTTDDRAATFDATISSPARPAARRNFAQSVSHAAPIPGSKSLGDSIRAVVDEEFQLALRRAEGAVSRQRSTTSLIRLAQAHESCAEVVEAVRAATEVLSLAATARDAADTDVFAVRLALELLVRNREFDIVEDFSSRLLIDDATRLVLGSAFAELGRFDVAHRLLEPVDIETKSASLAYLYLSEGHDRQAIPLLRRALRAVPSDAESTHNLSIAFARIGAPRKALATALRATRANPSRRDISLHYLELLMQNGYVTQVTEEIDRLLKLGVQVTPNLMVMQARAALSLGHTEQGERLLAEAARRINPEKDSGAFAEIQSNLLRIRVVTGHARREIALEQLAALNERFPQHSIVVSNMAQASERRYHAAALMEAFERSDAVLTGARRAYVSFQIAQLQGENEQAANFASAWVAAEPNNPRAISSAMVALGIGVERWSDALPIAEGVLTSTRLDVGLINNAAYIYAMAGRGEDAIRVLTDHAATDSTLKATLGLAHLAVGNVSEGFRLYREAAHSPRARDHEFLSLITLYQALVVRQLGLDGETDATHLAALSLAPVNLPDDWQQRPEFLRLFWVANRHSYRWPLSI